MIDTAPDALRCILDSLILDESCHESLKVMKNLSCVCKATVAVMNNPSFVASVCVPWLAPYRVQLRIPQMDTHAILQALDAHTTHAGLLFKGFHTLISHFHAMRYYEAELPDDELEFDACPCDLMMPVIMKAMTAHPASPSVLHLACIVTALYCGTKYVSCTEVVASGIRVLALEAESKYCADPNIHTYTGFQMLLELLQRLAPQ